MNFPRIYYVSSVRTIMFLVIISCIPGILTKFYFFGTGVLIQITLSIIVAVLLEMIFLKTRSKSIKMHLKDNSVVLTAVLFALSIPSLLPWWITIIGLLFSIIIGKHLYGGIGQNIFNPAMVGYVVLLISFPIYMNSWNEHHSYVSFSKDFQQSFNIIFLNNDRDICNIDCNVSIDAYTEATPLDNFKMQSYVNYNDIFKKHMFNHQNVIKNSWKYINISFFLGGIFLLFKKVICWRIPLSFLMMLGLISSITCLYNNDVFMSPVFHFLSGGTMMCAFFIATDPVTASCTNVGKIIFGILLGFLVWVLRNYSDYPDGIAFSVLLSNMLVPLIDYYTKTSGYGHNKTCK